MGAASVPGVKRGCGTRAEGGIYLEVGTSKDGLPLEAFIADPPVPYKAEQAIGVQVLPGPDGHHHVFDHVGATHYPHAPDILEEGRLFGFSRRVSPQVDLSLLDEFSRIVLVHPKGRLANAAELAKHLGVAVPPDHCAHYHKAMGFAFRAWNAAELAAELAGPIDQQHPLAHFADMGIPCNRHAYHFIPPDATEGGRGYRVLPELQYAVDPLIELPEGLTPKWESAIIASLPLTNISVIKARDGSHAERIEKVRKQVGERISVGEADA